MKTRKTIVTCLAALAITFSQSQEYKDMIEDGSYSVFEIQKEAEAYFANRDTGKGSGYKQYKRWEYRAITEMDENGYLKSSDFYFKELERFNRYQNQRKNAQINNDNWTELGPTYYNQTAGWNPGVGRVTSFAIDKKNTNHIIIGSNVGGVWKTTDEGQTWASLTDNYNNMDVFALAMDPNDTNIYYWGSTSGNIYKSENAGATWQRIGRAGNRSVNKILINPDNTQLLFASTGSGGFYKSENAGVSWAKVIDDRRAYDIEFKPGDLNIVYASGESVYKSTDGGNSFFAVGNVFSTGAKMMGVSPDNPDKVYVVEEKSGEFNGFYVSTDSGDSFVKKDHTDKNYFGFSSDADDDFGQAPRDMDIVVSPTNENEVHIAGLLTWRSTDGGDTFSITSQWIPGRAENQNIGYCHSDIDIMEFVGNRLFVGSDGGIYVADDPTTVDTNYFRNLTEGLGIRAFYRFGISQTDPVVITGGSQDNGTSTYTESRGWTDWLGADGMETFVDKNNTDILYGTSQNGSLYKTTNQGVRYIGLKEPENRGNWITPFEQDPQEENTVYAGYRKVYKSADGGNTWTAISQEFPKRLNHLKIAASDNTIMYAAHENNLYIESDGDGNWTQLNGFSGNINMIAIHPTNPNKVAIATTASAKVYVSEDAGDTWTSLRKNLPNFSALSLAWQDNNVDGLYLGMNYGVYYIDDSLEEWETFNNNLPNVRVNELEINYADNRIYAATYGRGAWSSPLYESNSLSIDEQKILADITTFPNPARGNVNIQWKDGKDVAVRLFNIQGQLVHYKKGISLQDPYQINTSAFSTGTYFLRINSQKGVFTKKLLVE